MKARRFAEECRVGAQTLQGVNAPEPTVVMRAGPDGQEVPIKAVKIRHDHQRKVPRSYIILEVGPHYPTEDAYLAACRANHWRAAQLRALGAEPLDLSKLPKDQLTHYPPDDFNWGDSGLTIERIADAMQKAIESNTHPSYVDNLGDGESIIIDGTVNLAVLAEELRR